MGESFHKLTNLLFACSYNSDMYRADFNADKMCVTVYNGYKVVLTVEDKQLDIEQLSKKVIDRIFLAGLVSIEAKAKLNKMPT